MNETITIGPATPDDLMMVRDIEERNLGLWSPAQFVEELTFDHSKFLVARLGNAVAGFIIAWCVADEIQVISLATDRPYRRRGIARALMQTLIGAAPDDARRLYLEVAAGNSDARHFYHTMGFVEIGLRRQFYGDDDAILMGKDRTS